MIEQDLSNVDLEMTVPTRWRRLQKTVAEIEGLCGGLLDLSHLIPFDQHDDA